MKCLLISDFSLKHTPGGAQRSNKIIIDKGLSLGHEITEFNYDSSIDLLFDEYDVIISSNLEVISSRVNGIINFLASKDNHVRLEHDMNMYLSEQDRRVLWESCKISFFLTEFHYECFKKHYGDYFINVEIVPDPIDISFRDLKLERKNVCLYVGFMHELKGTFNFLDYVDNNPNKSFVSACWGDKLFTDEISKRKNIQNLGVVHHDRMPELYNSVSEVFYAPNCYEPFCRAIGEAIVCGVPNIICNDIIGSLNMFKKDKANFANKCYNAANTFWEKIDDKFTKRSY